MDHQHYMQRCLDLAILGMGAVSPNPMVGCVIVLNDEIIGEGYHKKHGEAHAEVNAINAVLAKFGAAASAMLAEATAYVSLEPCAHFGKTPPCADLLVKHKLKSVVIGSTDPFAGVNGKGIAKLKDAGIAVTIGILPDECYALNRRFFTRVTKQRPYIILKWAQTKNGFFAPKDGSKKWISGQEAKVLTHQWRSQEDAILVGKNTAMSDNPQLNTREVEGKSPIRILIDKDLAVPTTHYIYDDSAKTYIFNEVKTDVIGNVSFIQIEDMHFYLPQKIAYQLYILDIQSVIIEGGANILHQFITANLWDEARIFTSNTTWDDGITAPKLIGESVEKMSIGSDELQVIKNTAQ